MGFWRHTWSGRGSTVLHRQLPLATVTLAFCFAAYWVARPQHYVVPAVGLLASLAATGVLLALGWYRDVSYQLYDLQDRLRSLDAQQRSHSAKPGGVSRVHDTPRKLLADFRAIVGAAESRVDLMGTTLVELVWSPAFAPAIKDALAQGVRFRVLLLDPDGDGIGFVARQEGRLQESYRHELSRSLATWQAMGPLQSDDQVTVRLYDGMPVGTAAFVDDALFVAPYLGGGFDLGAFLLEISDGVGPVYSAYRDYFSRCWDRAKEAGPALAHGQ